MSEHFDQRHWYNGFQPGQADCDQLQSFQDEAFTRIQLNYTGPGAAVPFTCSGQIPATLIIGIGAAKFIGLNGKAFGWGSSQNVDLSTATQGSTLGPTSPLNVGNKRYIVVAGRHAYVESDSRIDRTGTPVNFQKNSSFELSVWQSTDVANADDIYTSSTLSTILSTIEAAGWLPIVVGTRAYGSSQIATADLWQLCKYVRTDKDPQGADKKTASHLAFGTLPSVHTSDGKAPITVQSVIGLTGRVNIAAFSASIGWKDTRENRMKMIEVDVASMTLDLTQTNKNHIIRMKIGPDRVPTIYAAFCGTGTSNFGDDAYPGISGSSQSSANSAGFRATMVDMPLAQVNTGALDGTPTLTLINSGVQRVVDLENVIASTNAKILRIDEDFNRVFGTKREPRDLVYGGGLSQIGTGGSISMKIAAGAVYFSENESDLTKQRVIKWEDSTIGPFSVTARMYVLEVGIDGTFYLSSYNGTSLGANRVPIAWMRIASVSGVLAVVNYFKVPAIRENREGIVDWKYDNGLLGIMGGIHEYSDGRKIVMPHLIDITSPSAWLGGVVQNVASGTDFRYMYLVPPLESGAPPSPVDKGVACIVKLSNEAPSANGFHPSNADAGIYYPFFGSFPVHGSSSIVPWKSYRLNGWVTWSGNRLDNDVTNGTPPFKSLTAVGTANFTDTDVPKTATQFELEVFSESSDQALRVVVNNLIDGSQYSLCSDVLSITRVATTPVVTFGQYVKRRVPRMRTGISTPVALTPAVLQVQVALSGVGSWTTGNAGMTVTGYYENLLNPYNYQVS
jgi:hypothetical protein